MTILGQLSWPSVVQCERDINVNKQTNHQFYLFGSLDGLLFKIQISKNNNMTAKSIVN